MTPAGPRGALAVRAVGSAALIADLDSIEEVLALRTAMEYDTPPGVRELVAAARTLLVTYDPAVTGHDALAREMTRRAAGTTVAAGQRLDATERSGAADGAGAPDGPGTLIVPVRYDGPDLAEAAALTGLTVDEVIARHTAPLYTVAFAGFAPGFGYLTGTDPVLGLSRRAEPRTEVPAGAVAVAGGFTGIYPRPSPGGWRLLGTTSLALWDERRDPPALLVPGRPVRLRAVGR
ncbi:MULTISPECIES: allophanate hydrolase subunit 1 [unclassified Streptomyces]|uniref:5-oxoprolinase subunit B family protein n=1 Tax=unclassified Streptomyces TaxID=2593676 RepID=UPI0037F5F8A9